MRNNRSRLALAGGLLSLALVATACSGGFGGNAGNVGGGGGGDSGGGSTNDGGGTSGVTIDGIAVNLPAQEDLVAMTAEHFTPAAGSTVNFTLLPENDVRAKITQKFSSQARVYDVAPPSNCEIASYAGDCLGVPVSASLAQ